MKVYNIPISTSRFSPLVCVWFGRKIVKREIGEREQGKRDIE